MEVLTGEKEELGRKRGGVNRGGRKKVGRYERNTVILDIGKESPDRGCLRNSG